ncbi:MAG: flagellar hook-associated protein FlgL [Terriglobia bacterium]
MGLRIAPSLYSTLLYDVSNDRDRLNTDFQQVSTGQSVNLPSDNPAATAVLIQNKSEASGIDEYTQSIASLKGSLSTADTALGSVVGSLNQALSIATEGANGTNSPGELQGLAQQVQAIQQTVLGLANTSYQGVYLFAGTNSTAPAYVSDLTSPSGVKYSGNTAVNNVSVGPGQSAQANLPGSTIFNGAGADVFQALHDLSKALTTDTNVTGALSELQSAYNNVNTQRTFYGNTIDDLNSVSGDLSQEQLTLSTQLSTLISANPAQAASNLSQDETTLQSALNAFGSISQNTLLNYLKLG